jgi:hypothetical protein
MHGRPRCNIEGGCAFVVGQSSPGLSHCCCWRSSRLSRCHRSAAESGLDRETQSRCRQMRWAPAANGRHRRRRVGDFSRPGRSRARSTPDGQGRCGTCGRFRRLTLVRKRTQLLERLPPVATRRSASGPTGPARLYDDAGWAIIWRRHGASRSYALCAPAGSFLGVARPLRRPMPLSALSRAPISTARVAGKRTCGWIRLTGFPRATLALRN